MYRLSSDDLTDPFRLLPVPPVTRQMAQVLHLKLDRRSLGRARHAVVRSVRYADTLREVDTRQRDARRGIERCKKPVA